MSGFIAIERDMWDHPVLARSEMSETEAWAWMIAQASWGGTAHMVGNDLVKVERGSFMITLRKLQSEFMWKSDKRVRNFLKKLENHGMLAVQTLGQRNARKTHVTICKYEEYQSRGRSKDAAKTHDGRTTDAVKKQGNKVTKEEPKGSLASGDDAQAKPIDDISKAVSAYNIAAEQSGWPKVAALSPARRSALAGRLREAGGLAGWDAALSRAQASDYCCGDNNRGWVANFDFITRQSSFSKLMEGNYDNRAQTHRHPNGNSALRAIATAATMR